MYLIVSMCANANRTVIADQRFKTVRSPQSVREKKLALTFEPHCLPLSCTYILSYFFLYAYHVNLDLFCFRVFKKSQDFRRGKRLEKRGKMISVAAPQRPLSTDVITLFWSQQNVKEADSNDGLCCERGFHLIRPRYLNNGWLAVRRVIVLAILPTDVHPQHISADFCSGLSRPRTET